MILSVENAAINVNGSSKQGGIKATFLELVNSFGPPTLRDHSGDDKVTMEWNLTFEMEDGDYVKATIYDWKQSVPGEFVEEWSIGGFDRMADIAVNAVVECDRVLKKC